MNALQMFFGIGGIALAWGYAFARVYKPEEGFRTFLLLSFLFFIVMFLRV